MEPEQTSDNENNETPKVLTMEAPDEHGHEDRPAEEREIREDGNDDNNQHEIAEANSPNHDEGMGMGEEENKAEHEEHEEESSAISDLTDEEDRLEKIRLEKEAIDEERQKERDKKIKQNLNQVVLSPIRKKYMYFMKHAEVNSVLSFFWNLFLKDSHANVLKEDIKMFIQRLFKLLLAPLSDEEISNFSEEILEREKMRESSFFTQNDFFEILLNLVDIFIEQQDIQTTSTFLSFIRNRLVEIVVKKSDGTEVLVDTKFRVRFYNINNMNQKLKREMLYEKQPENVIYCFEKYLEFEDEVEKGLRDSVVTRFKKYSEIVPLGKASNDIVESLINENDVSELYNIENQQEVVSTFLRNEKILFYVGFVIEDTDGQIIRLSPALFLPFIFENLKDKWERSAYVNQRAVFKANIKIDKVHQYVKRWNEPFEVQKPQDYEIQGKSLDEIFNILLLNKYRLNGFPDEEHKYQDLDFKTSDTFPTIKSEDLTKFQTREATLPYDNPNFYQNDLIDFVKERPFHILVHGKPKIGKSKFCKRLAEKLDLEVIDAEIFVKKLMERVAQGEEEVEMDDDGNPIEFLKDYERQIVNDLRGGGRIQRDNLLKLINESIMKLKVEQKG